MRRRGAIVGLCLIATGGAQLDGGHQALGYPRPHRFELVSEPVDMKPPPTPVGFLLFDSQNSTISANGRYIAFTSIAPNMTKIDHNGVIEDVFVRDVLRDRTWLVSVSSAGEASIAHSSAPRISGNGRYVAFATASPNLVPGDTNLVRDVFVHDRLRGTTERVSVSKRGEEGNGISDQPAISVDGRFVAFASESSNLAPGDANPRRDVFLHDRVTDRTELVSVSSNGEQANSVSLAPHISKRGRQVAFYTLATNLGGVVGPGAAGSVYVRDRTKRTTELISAREEPQVLQPFVNSMMDPSGDRGISDNGRYVAFQSARSDLVPNDANGGRLFSSDIFVKDRKSGRIERVSVTSQGQETSPGFSSVSPAISGDGRFVIFWSEAPDVSAGEPGPAVGQPVESGDNDLFIHDRHTGTTEWVSNPPYGDRSAPTRRLLEGYRPHSLTASMSRDGRYSVFPAPDDGFVKGDDNNAFDVFFYDRGPRMGLTDASRRVAIGGGPEAQASPFVVLSDPHGDVSVPSGDLLDTDVVFRPRLDDLFVRLRLADLGKAEPGMVYGIRFRVHGDRYEVRAAAPTTAAGFGLFRCGDGAAMCERLGSLRGGWGTTGLEIVVSLPLDAIGIDGDARIRHPSAYSGRGTLVTGPIAIQDEALLRD